jgi:hypothetical protein
MVTSTIRLRNAARHGDDTHDGAHRKFPSLIEILYVSGGDASRNAPNYLGDHDSVEGSGGEDGHVP